MAVSSRRPRRQSVSSDSSSSASSPERDPIYDDGDSLMEHANDSQSSLGVSMQDMELDAVEYEEQCRLSPISRLPPELLITIFSKLASPADMKNCMLVSRAWARNSVDLLWHRPLTSDWRKLLNVIGSARKKDGFFPYHDLIKRLNLSALGEQISDGTLYPMVGCKRIERLTLTGCTKLTDVSVESLISGNRSLLALDISGLDFITDYTLFAVAESCCKLQGLNVTNCKGITDASLVAIAERCRRVKRLKFNGCSQITDRCILSFADHCNDILEIDLQGCDLLTDIAVTALIENGRQLRELRLAYCSRITDDAFLALPAEMHFENLRILDLTDCRELNDAGLQKIVSAAPRLRNMVLAKCGFITDRGVMTITRLGKNLHYIHLGHCTRITDYGLGHLVKHCNRIRYIDLACCQNLTDESVIHLAALPKLKRIGLVKCSNITDLSIKELARPKPLGSNGGFYPNNLERLHLSYCVNLTVEGVRTMLINCPRLTHLSLTGINEFLRPDISGYCREPPPEFNDHQREVFCVFSGKGVGELREYLREAYPSPPASDAGLDSGLTYPNGPLFYPTSWRQTPPQDMLLPGPNLWSQVVVTNPGQPAPALNPLQHYQTLTEHQQWLYQQSLLEYQASMQAAASTLSSRVPTDPSHLDEDVGEGVDGRADRE